VLLARIIACINKPFWWGTIINYEIMRENPDFCVFFISSRPYTDSNYGSAAPMVHEIVLPNAVMEQQSSTGATGSSRRTIMTYKRAKLE